MIGTLSKLAEISTSNKNNEKINPLNAIDNIGHTTVDATINNTTNYIADVLDPSWKAIKNLGNVLNPMSYKRNGFKNIIKAPAGAITQGATAVKNLAFGINSWIKTLYKEGIQNNVKNIENATIEHIPYVGPFVNKIINFALAIPAVIPAVIDGIGGYLDQDLDKANEFVKLEGQNLAKVRMR